MIERKIYNDMPVILLYENGTLVHTLRFSERDNRAIPRTVREPYSLAAPTQTASGERVAHDAGFYLRHSFGFQVWGPGYCCDSDGLQFTERELALLWWARQNTETVEVVFYPHASLAGAGPATPDRDYCVLVEQADIQPGLAQDRFAGTVELMSRYPITDTDKFAWL